MLTLHMWAGPGTLGPTNMAATTVDGASSHAAVTSASIMQQLMEHNKASSF